MSSSIPPKMNALVLKSPENLEFMEVPVPKLSGEQVLIKVSKCGICGSDIRYFYGENPWAKQTLQQDIPNPPNIIFGHEFSGTVIKVNDADSEYLLGKRVGVQTWTTCGICVDCRSGRENFCKQTKHLGHGQGWGKMEFYPGGMAEYCPASLKNVYELPESITDEQATFLDPMTAAIHAVDIAKPALLDKVVVLGAGPIGLIIAQTVKAMGASKVFITDINDTNLTIARELGINNLLNVKTSRIGITEAVTQVIGPGGANCVYNTIGSNTSLIESLGLLCNEGVLVMMATKDKDINFPALMLSGERTIKTSTNARFSDFLRSISLLEAGLVKVDPMITHRFKLSEGILAFETACKKSETQAVKIILDCQS